jgi:hypothetical protein
MPVSFGGTYGSIISILRSNFAWPMPYPECKMSRQSLPSPRRLLCTFWTPTGAEFISNLSRGGSSARTDGVPHASGLRRN